MCVSVTVRKCFLSDISKTLLLLAVSEVPRCPSLPGMIIVTFAKRSPLLHCENNHDWTVVLATGPILCIRTIRRTLPCVE